MDPGLHSDGSGAPRAASSERRLLRRLAALGAVAGAAFALRAFLPNAERSKPMPPAAERRDPRGSAAGATTESSGSGTELPDARGPRAFTKDLQGLRPRSSAPWRVPEAEFRQIVELALLPAQVSKTDLLPAGAPAPPSTARCELRFSPDLPAGAGVRVFGASGRELACSLRRMADLAELVVELSGEQGPFEVYYPVSGAQAPAEGAGALAAGTGLGLSARELPPGRAEGLHRLSQVVSAFKEARPTGDVRVWRQIDDRASPFGRQDHYIAIYQGWLACPRDGTYAFGLDADDRAFLLLDGEEVLAGGAPGHLPPRPFAFRSARSLRAGLHALTLYHVQGTGALRARLAWQPPGESRMRPIPPSAFAAHVPARAVALERRTSDSCEVFFAASPGRRFFVNGEVPVTEWELVASGPQAAGDAGLAWVWREGYRILGEGPRLGLFVSGAPGQGPRKVALSLETPSGGLGRYAGVLHALPGDPLEDEELKFRIELGSAPVFLYPHEPFEVYVHAINDSDEPVTLEVVERLEGKMEGSIVASPLGEFELPPVGPAESDMLAKRMNRIRRRFGSGEAERIARLVYTLGLKDAPVASLALEFLSSREGRCPPLVARDGALWVEASHDETLALHGAGPRGRRRARAIVVLPFDTEGDLRRWAFLKGISPIASAFARGVLFYGDPLESPGAALGEGLEERLRRLLEPEGLEFESARFPAGEYPIHAAAAGADAVFARARARRIWVSLGLADARAGTPIQEFERGIDFLIDRARALAPGARLVLVGPPPEWGREIASARYAAAARAVAAQHRVPLVDIHAMLERPELMDSAYRESGPDDGVRFVYPLGEAMDRIAREAFSR